MPKKRKTPWWRKPEPFWPYGALAFLVLLFCDQYTKRAILSFMQEGQSVHVLPFLRYTFVHNDGTIWGLLANTNLIFIVFSLVAVAFVWIYREEFETTIEKASVAILLAGIAGNFLDRLLLGYVIDFIDFGWWPIFNIADMAISVGIVVFLLEELRKYRLQKAGKKI